MKLLILAVSLLIGGCFLGCTDKELHEEVKIKNNARYNGGLWASMEWDYTVITVDSCEYLIVYGVGGRSVIHKENCKNAFHLVKR